MRQSNGICAVSTPAEELKNRAYKLELFEYVVFKLIEWFKESKGENYTIEDFNKDPKNDFSVLKLIKLHFFVSAISVGLRSSNENKDLLDIFDNFHALPFGHVESDVYDAIKAGMVKRFALSSQSLEIKTEYRDWIGLSDSFKSERITTEHKEMVESSINALKSESHNFVLYPTYELVEISHSWVSWRESREQALQNGSNAQKIPINLIRNEKKVFTY